MPVVSITRLRVRSWIYLPAFLLRALRIGGQAKRAPGNLGAKILNDRRRTFWTCTCWDSETAMRAFMLGPPHGPAMRKLLEWCDEASLVHWSQPRPELPTWREAHERLWREGRRSKVNHPSEDHNRYVIAPPRTDRHGEVRLK
jgi:Domain of unknown function (DUF3291)